MNQAVGQDAVTPFDLAAYAPRVSSYPEDRATVIANLSRFPARVKCRGIFFQGVSRLIAETHGQETVSTLFGFAGVAERKVSFKLYPHVDFYKVYYLSAALLEPGVRLPEALRRTARKFFPIFRESVVGRTMSAWMGKPHLSSSAITMNCGTAMIRQASRAARSTPSTAGRLASPICRSPSTDLKSFSVMIPCAPAL